MIAVIPARYQSSRFPGKPLVLISGLPLVVHVFKKVEQVFDRSQIFVATDDERIQRKCLEFGIQVRMTSNQCLTGTDRVYEAIQPLAEETIISVQGDEPLVHPDDIRTVVRAKEKHNEYIINAMCAIDDRKDIESPNVPKVVVNEMDDLVYMSRAPIPFLKARNVKVSYFRQVCIYGFNRGQLKSFCERGCKSAIEEPEDIEILRFLDLGIGIKMVRVKQLSVAVDVPEDVGRVESLLKGSS